MAPYPPLTAAELAAIYDGDPRPSVLRLLHEIRRLHEMVRRADQVRRTLGGVGRFHVPDPIWDCFERELSAEPCLRDLPTPRQMKRQGEAFRRQQAMGKSGRRD